MTQFNFMIIVGLLLTGCSSYQEQFDCPAGVGVGCKSLASVDQMIDQGVLPRSTPLANNAVDPALMSVDKTSPEIRFIMRDDGDGIDPSGVQRTPEQIMRLWVRGYTDTQDNYHADSTVYTVVRPAEWHVSDRVSQQPIALQPKA